VVGSQGERNARAGALLPVGELRGGGRVAVVVATVAEPGAHGRDGLDGDADLAATSEPAREGEAPVGLGRNSAGLIEVANPLGHYRASPGPDGDDGVLVADRRENLELRLLGAQPHRQTGGVFEQ